MSLPRLVVLVRHGAPEPFGRRSGNPDPALSSAGADGIARSKRALARFGRFDRCFHSHHRVSRESATALGRASVLVEDPRLAEVGLGREPLDGNESIALACGPAVDIVWNGRPYDHRGSGAETWTDAEMRVHSFLMTLRHDYADHNVLVIVPAHWHLLFRRIVEGRSVAETVADARAALLPHAAMRFYAKKGEGALERLEPAPEHDIGHAT